jgi:hypothetical protein
MVLSQRLVQGHLRIRLKQPAEAHHMALVLLRVMALELARARQASQRVDNPQAQLEQVLLEQVLLEQVLPEWVLPEWVPVEQVPVEQ